MKKYITFFSYALLSSAMTFTLVACGDDEDNSSAVPDTRTEAGKAAQMVDLGLPSGTLWADRNVGAEAPEEYGDYFAWGETEPKSDYSWSTYKYGKDEDELTKYCSKSSYGKDGYTDSYTELLPEDDAASVNWGGNWRMPSFEQIKELYNNTDNTWVDDFEGTGVSGRKFTNKKDSSKFIFLPAAGKRNGTSLDMAGSSGYYWSRTLNTGSPYEARSVNFGSGSVNLYDYTSRYYGQAVRPVGAP
ncbi:MAG: hypothetical protein IKR91_03965 [Alloprevotella sp.]|nr:hypothetical protein [Alloprevotella sp.]